MFGLMDVNIIILSILNLYTYDCDICSFLCFGYYYNVAIITWYYIMAIIHMAIITATIIISWLSLHRGYYGIEGQVIIIHI